MGLMCLIFFFPAAKKKTKAADSDKGSVKPPPSPFTSSVSGVSLPQQFICSLSLIHGHRLNELCGRSPTGIVPEPAAEKEKAKQGDSRPAAH